VLPFFANKTKARSSQDTSLRLSTRVMDQGTSLKLGVFETEDDKVSHGRAAVASSRVDGQDGVAATEINRCR